MIHNLRTAPRLEENRPRTLPCQNFPRIFPQEPIIWLKRAGRLTRTLIMTVARRTPRKHSANDSRKRIRKFSSDEFPTCDGSGERLPSPETHLHLLPTFGDQKRWHGSTWALRVATRDLEILARQVTLMGEFFSLGVR